MSAMSAEARFRSAYGAQRAAEGRGISGAALFELPYVRHGPVARQWLVRARSYEVFMRRVLAPLAMRSRRTLRVADLGAGNGWLSWRIARLGHAVVALDIRDDSVDGLGAASTYAESVAGRLQRCVATFERLPLADGCCDLVVFDASLHYAVDLGSALREALRVLGKNGRVAIIDSPFYEHARDGDAMVAEKRRTAHVQFGTRADALMELPFVEYLTRDRLAVEPAVGWTRHRVRYPLWYELRPAMARLRRRRMPSRFDVWEGVPA